MADLISIAKNIYELEKECQENKCINLDYYMNRIEELTGNLTMPEMIAVDEMIQEYLTSSTEVKGE